MDKVTYSRLLGSVKTVGSHVFVYGLQEFE